MDITEIRKQKAQIEMMFILSGISMIIGFFLFVIHPALAFLVMIICMFFLYYNQKRFKKLSIEFKEHYVKKVVDEIIPGCIYEPLKGIDSSEVYASKILHKEDRFHSEDLLSGTLLGKHFISSDIHLQDVRSNGKSTTVVTVFRGRFFIIDSSINYDEEIYIMPNHTFLFAYGENMMKIDLEYIDFNQQFDVFSHDQHATFALLKPRFMEKLIEFSNVGKRIMFGFKDKTIYVAIDTRKDSFDFKFMSPLDDVYFNEIKDEIQMMKDLLALLA